MEQGSGPGQSHCCLLCIVAIINYLVLKAIESLDLTFVYLLAWLLLNLIVAFRGQAESYRGLAGGSGSLAETSGGLVGASGGLAGAL